MNHLCSSKDESVQRFKVLHVQKVCYELPMPRTVTVFLLKRIRGYLLSKLEYFTSEKGVFINLVVTIINKKLSCQRRRKRMTAATVSATTTKFGGAL